MGEYKDFVKDEMTYFKDKPFSYYRINLNPAGGAGDCLIRAIMQATGRTTKKDWEDIYWKLTEIAMEKYKVFNDMEVTEEFLSEYGYTYHECSPKECVNMKRFAEEHTEGNYIVILEKHAIAYVDGVIYDNRRIFNDKAAKRMLEDRYTVYAVFTKKEEVKDKELEEPEEITKEKLEEKSRVQLSSFGSFDWLSYEQMMIDFDNNCSKYRIGISDPNNFTHPSDYKNKDNHVSIFLAGPSPDNNHFFQDPAIPHWRKEFVDLLCRYKEDSYLERTKYHIYVPTTKYSKAIDFNDRDAVRKYHNWCSDIMDNVDYIVFWIPRYVDRGEYRLHTNIEIGKYLIKDPDKCIIGWPEDAQYISYIEDMIEYYNCQVGHISDTLEELAVCTSITIHHNLKKN